MKNIQKWGGISALYAGAAYIMGMLFFLVIVDYMNVTDPMEKLILIVNNHTGLYAITMIIYVFFAVFLVLLSLALYERLKEATPLVIQTATIFGLIWATILIASGMIFNIGMENERKTITFDPRSIAITIVISSHKRMKDLWKIIRVLDKGGNKDDILEKTSVKRPFVDKMIKQAKNFKEEEMSEKWKYMLDADLLCKTSRLSPTLIVEQLITKLCMWPRNELNNTVS